MRPNPQFSADLVTFTEEIFNEKMKNFIFCAVICGLDNFPLHAGGLKLNFSRGH